MAQNIAPTLPTTGPAGTEVQHHPDCVCEGDSAPDKTPAFMWDERAVLGYSFLDACYREVCKRLKSTGHPASHYRRERFRADGERIGPELAIRTCETVMAINLSLAVSEFLDEMLPGSNR